MTENIHTAINRVMQSVGYVKKESAPKLGYTFAGESALIQALRPSMVEHGIYMHGEKEKYKIGIRRERGLVLISKPSGLDMLFDPEHDRNAAHELLMEVGRRGLNRRFGYALRFALDGETMPNGATLDTEFINDSDDISDYTFLVATAPLDLIVTAACEVLEEN